MNLCFKWVPELLNYCPNALWILAGLKADLNEDEETLQSLKQQKETPIKVDEGSKMATAIGAVFHLQCSAITGMNVQELFTNATKLTLEAKKKREKSRRRK